ncbi:DUF1993 domain-containing protein [Chondromyces crocatus]|uniref:DUF1993 domain-containing protein n=1 Tax=Chondromyces crocatus TaxID=52 RepID=A0A0K1ET48_CHOCO|nr:DUF1993 domain-containing protein [Chondromyces crocatus]AKT43803.1 uncharacterized protein CMC5_080400 [Chondromyces crocatus]
MTLSMYESSVPVFLRAFANLSAILRKAVDYAEVEKLDPDTLTQARLIPDMAPLTAQVQFASDIAKGCAARLAGVEVPSFADKETNFTELQERIAKTVAFLESIDPAKFEGSEERGIELNIGGNPLGFEGRRYLLDFALPNFYFHVTMAYALLRHKGVQIGKRDFLGGV